MLTILYWQAPSLPGPYLSAGTKDRDAGAITLEPLAKDDPDGDLVPALAAQIPNQMDCSIIGFAHPLHPNITLNRIPSKVGLEKFVETSSQITIGRWHWAFDFSDKRKAALRRRG